MGNFHKTPKKHLEGSECNKCIAIILSVKRKNNEKELFIKKSKLVYNDIYDYSKVDYKNNLTKVIIICKLHGEFEQFPRNHINGSGCKDCNNELFDKQISGKEFINRANNIYNNKYIYENINFVKPNNKIIIECLQHGKFEIKAKTHLVGKGCYQCDSLAKFIENANIRHNNTYDYSKVQYVNSDTKVIIICKIHGEFLQTPEGHIYGGYKCIKCVKYPQFTTEIFIERAKKVHGDKYDYSKVDCKNTLDKIIIICGKHGEFMQTPDSHIRKEVDCPLCTGNIKYTTQTFVDKAKTIHGNEYDYSEVKYGEWKSKITIICGIHGKFEQSAGGHLMGHGCFKCYGTKKYTTEEFIEKAKIVHKDKYDYSKVKYNDKRSKIIIICEEHGEFEQIAGNHVRGMGCLECYGTKKYTKETFIKKANIIYGDKYDYSKVEYDNKNSKIIIICKEHGEFEHIAMCHLMGSECAKCGYKVKFLQKAIEFHGNKYDYSKVNYFHFKTCITIICKIHGQFEETPESHLRSVNCCPKCKLCPSCQLWKTGGKLCLYCVPKDKNKLYYKSKEMDVVRFLKSNLPNNDFIHNKSIGTSCGVGHLFPDILFDLQFYNLIVEIDEHKHRGANYACDKKRMYDIIAKLGLPCIFIRYNPDSKLSDKNVLLTKVNEYLNIQPDNNIFDDFGFKADYLFY